MFKEKGKKYNKRDHGVLLWQTASQGRDFHIFYSKHTINGKELKEFNGNRSQRLDFIKGIDGMMGRNVLFCERESTGFDGFAD